MSPNQRGTNVPAGSLILSGLMSLITHTAAITSLTPAGGLFMVLTMVMSAGLRVLRAARAASRAGMASARSPSHWEGGRGRGREGGEGGREGGGEGGREGGREGERERGREGERSQLDYVCSHHYTATPLKWT